MLLIGSLGAMWTWWGKLFHEPKSGSGHVWRVMAWTRHQGLVPYIDFEKVRGDLCYLSLRPINARIWHKAVFKVGPVAGPKPGGMAPWDRTISPVPRHTRQNRPEVRRPTECNPRTGEERPHTNALERPRGPLYLSLRTTNARIWHKAVFKVCPVAGPKPTRVRQGQKYLRPRRHSPLWGASSARQ